MSIAVLLPALTSLLAFAFALALLDQWLERRRGFQADLGSGHALLRASARRARRIGAALPVDQHWPELLYRTWYLTGAVFTAAWLGLGHRLSAGQDALWLRLRLPRLLWRLSRVRDAQHVQRRHARSARDHRRAGRRNRDRRRDLLPERALAADRCTDGDRGKRCGRLLRIHRPARRGHTRLAARSRPARRWPARSASSRCS